MDGGVAAVQVPVGPANMITDKSHLESIDESVEITYEDSDYTELGVDKRCRTLPTSLHSALVRGIRQSRLNIFNDHSGK